MDADIMPEIHTAENNLNEGMAHSNEDDTAEKNTHENEGEELDAPNRNILEDITTRLLSDQRRKGKICN